MRSRYADVFNHDDQAETYDVVVADELHPIRRGYKETLQAVAAYACALGKRDILDLGSGTGNLSQMLSGYHRLVCVDISRKTHDVARNKLADNGRIEYIEADLLQYFDSSPCHDMVVSTYALHHLTDDEKLHLFHKLWRCLPAEGMAIFGDLMFADRHTRDKMIQRFLRDGYHSVVRDIEEEFYWDIHWATKALIQIGFWVTTRWITELSWILIAEKR